MPATIPTGPVNVTSAARPELTGPQVLELSTPNQPKPDALKAAIDRLRALAGVKE
jgi:hypothetical protein